MRVVKNILKLFPYIKGFYTSLTGIAIFSLFIAAINAYLPQVYKEIVDTVSQHQGTLSWGLLQPYLIKLLVVSIVWVTVNFFFNILSSRNFQRVRGALRLAVFKRITTLSIDYFETNRPGEMVERTGSAIASFTGWVNSLNFSLMGPIFSIIVITIILLRSSLYLGVLALGIILFSGFMTRRARKQTKEPNQQWRTHNEKSVGIFAETIQNMTTISTLSNTDRFVRKLADEEQASLKLAFKVRGVWNGVSAKVTLFNELAFFLAVLVVLADLVHGTTSVGQFIALTAYFRTLRQDAWALADFIPDTERVERDVERLIDVLETQPTFPDSEKAIPLTKLESLEFRDVSFTYPTTSKGAISNISFTINSTNSVALVGPSGVGKSTITKLMLRFYPPTEGQIFINNQPADTFTQESVRRHIGMVMQDVALFNTTVKENLKLAKEKATAAELLYATDQAHATDFIEELPKKLHTIVGERGIKLSGGQKQRIAIARAILKNPDLIILDEATSALDSESEQLVQEGLKKLQSGRMSLTIAHRLSTVRHADEILVLKDGSITERGTHTELIKKPKGLYKKLFDLQSATGKVSL